MCFVAGALDSFDSAERKETFLAEAERHDLQVSVYQGNFTEISGYEVGCAILRADEKLNAVFCANDQMAIGLLRALHEHGLRAPDDVAVIGFDDILLSRYVQPQLSTIGTSRIEWGARAARQLLDFLDKEVPFEPQRLPTQFIPRESSTRIIRP
jgi:LacI family transcriptional regulator